MIRTNYGGDGGTFRVPKLSVEPINEGAVAPKFIICKEGESPKKPRDRDDY